VRLGEPDPEGRGPRLTCTQRDALESNPTAGITIATIDRCGRLRADIVPVPTGMQLMTR